MGKTAVLVLTSIGAALAVLGAAVHWPPAPLSLLSLVFLIDIAVVGLAGAVVVVVARAKPFAWSFTILWLACGALLGAAVAAPLTLAFWLFPAALAFGAAGTVAGLGGLRGTLGRVSLYIAAAIANFIFLWSSTVGSRAPVDPAAFSARDFRVVEFLSDVPLHDVWTFELRGGPAGLKLTDVQEMLAERSPLETPAIVAGLVGIRFAVGGAIGWDADEHFDSSASFTRRLTDADRERSLEEPGDASGLFRTVYTFENEALAEMMNRTAHAFFCMALEPAGDGYRMYWAIYVRETSRLTPVYMSLIDPFRRYIVYPAIVEGVEREWAVRFNARSSDTP